MKQTIFIIILLAATLVAAQNPDRPLAREFINEAIQETDAVINHEIDLEEEKYITLITSPPEYYEIGLVVPIINMLVNKYSNVSYYENWHEQQNQYRCFIYVDDNLVLITWHPRTKRLNYSY